MAWVAAGFAAASALSQGLAANKAAQFNAAVLGQNAALARQQGEMEAEQIRRLGRKRIGEARAAYAASGVRMTGSALDVLADSERQVELDAATARWNAELRASGMQSQAALSRMQGRAALTSSLLQAGAAGARGYGQAIRLTPTATPPGGEGP